MKAHEVPAQLRALLGIGILAGEGVWVRRTGLWTFQSFGGVANLQSLVGWLFPFLIFSSCVVIPGWRRGQSPSAPEGAFSRWTWAAAHLVCFAGFAAITRKLNSAAADATSTAFLAILWFVWGAASVVTLGGATLPAAFVRLWNRRALLLGCAVTVASLAVFRYFQGFWHGSSEISIQGVHWVLQTLGFQVFTANQTVGTERFFVEILPACSGYEGMGLFLAFSMAWLAWFRKEYRFPAALLLLPIGVAVSWSLNVLRIAGLIVIGHYGYPNIAVGGFHSQAGWMAFAVLAVGFCAISQRIPGMRAVAENSQRERLDDPAAAYLGPFVAMQAAAMIVAAMSAAAATGGFEWLYPLRVLAPAVVLLCYRREYGRFLRRPGLTAYAMGIGIAVSALWALMALRSAANAGPLLQLRQLPAPWRTAWWIFRFAGAVVVTPIAEELAFRGYLMRRVKGPEVEKVNPGQSGWLGMGVSSLAFGLLHGSRWLEGAAAGLLYGHVYARRGRLGDAILAHAITNLILMTAVFWAGDWRFW